MMIKIFEKKIPFTKTFGKEFLIPRTTLRATFFPTRIDFHELSSAHPFFMGTVALDLLEPKDCLFQLDLEKGLIRVSGSSQSGSFQYTVYADFASKSLQLVVKKGDVTPSSNNITIETDDNGSFNLIFSEEWRCLDRRPHFECLSFGVNKKQDTDLMLRRFDMAELMPFWYQLAQWVPKQDKAVYEGVASLIPSCCSAIINGDKSTILEPFQKLFKASFEGVFSPTLVDNFHQGFSINPITDKSKANPLQLLVEGALLIRSFLIQSCEGGFTLLPSLPVELHCGRALKIALSDKALIDIEWSKKQLRRAVIHPLKDADLQLKMPPYVKTFRIRESEREKGQIFSNGDTLTLVKDEILFLDHFRK